MKRQTLKYIFSCVVLIVYSWSFIVFFWDTPALLTKFSTSDVIGYLAYQLVFALFGSVFITGVVALTAYLITWIQNKKWKDKQLCIGVFLLIILAISSILFKEHPLIVSWLTQSTSLDQSAASYTSTFALIFSTIGMPLLILPLTKNERVCNWIYIAAESTLLLSTLYVALSILSLVIIMIRNIR